MLAALPQTDPQLRSKAAISQQLFLSGVESPLTGVLGDSGGHPFDPFQRFPTGCEFPFLLDLFGDPSQESRL